MTVIPYMLLISLCLVAIFLVFFVFLVRQGDYDHNSRMSLAPLREDDNAVTDKEIQKDD